MRQLFSGLAVLVLAIAVAGCASRGEQQAEQAEAAATKAQEAAARAEESATKALDAATKAIEAADRATKAVEEATREINRVADHLDQMERDRETAIHRRRVSHVTKSAREAASASGVCVFGKCPSGGSLGVAGRIRRRIRDLRRRHDIGRGASGAGCAGAIAPPPKK